MQCSWLQWYGQVRMPASPCHHMSYGSLRSTDWLKCWCEASELSTGKVTPVWVPQQRLALGVKPATLEDDREQGIQVWLAWCETLTDGLMGVRGNREDKMSEMERERGREKKKKGERTSMKREAWREIGRRGEQRHCRPSLGTYSALLFCAAEHCDQSAQRPSRNVRESRRAIRPMPKHAKQIMNRQNCR